MDEKIEKKPEELSPESDVAEVTELEEGDLEGVAGGGLAAEVPSDNTNCGNTQCCG